MIRLSAMMRRIVYVAVFEAIAIPLSTILLVLMNQGASEGSFTVAVVISAVAVTWNFIYNSGFEAMERRLGLARRGFWLRVMHSIGFEGGLILFTVPLLMFWYKVGVVQAFMMEAVILVFFLFYTFLFTLAFDHIVPRVSRQPTQHA